MAVLLPSSTFNTATLKLTLKKQFPINKQIQNVLSEVNQTSATLESKLQN